MDDRDIITQLYVKFGPEYLSKKLPMLILQIIVCIDSDKNLKLDNNLMRQIQNESWPKIRPRFVEALREPVTVENCSIIVNFNLVSDSSCYFIITNDCRVEIIATALKIIIDKFNLRLSNFHIDFTLFDLIKYKHSECVNF